MSARNSINAQREASESKAARLEAEGKLLTAEAARIQVQSKLEQQERELKSLCESSASFAHTSAGGGGLQVDALKQLSAELKAAEDERDGVRDRELQATKKANKKELEALQATKETNKKELEARAAALTDAQAEQRKVCN